MKDFQFINGDCLEEMKTLPDSSVDLICCDPPYGILTATADWDKIININDMWTQFHRLIKPNCPIILFSQQPFTSKLIMSNLDKFRCEWIWDKHIPRGLHSCKFKPMSRHENILVFADKIYNYYPIMVERDKPIKRKAYNKDKTYFNGANDMEYRTYTHINPCSIITDLWEANKGKIHPTQKPVSLIEYLLTTYSKEGDVILDPTYGSCSTGLACKNLNRQFIGIEMDENYFNLGKNRVINR